jgi:hypothetical protein
MVDKDPGQGMGAQGFANQRRGDLGVHPGQASPE